MNEIPEPRKYEYKVGGRIVTVSNNYGKGWCATVDGDSNVYMDIDALTADDARDLVMPVAQKLDALDYQINALIQERSDFTYEVNRRNRRTR